MAKNLGNLTHNDFLGLTNFIEDESIKSEVAVAVLSDKKANTQIGLGYELITKEGISSEFLKSALSLVKSDYDKSQILKSSDLEEIDSTNSREFFLSLVGNSYYKSEIERFWREKSKTEEEESKEFPASEPKKPKGSSIIGATEHKGAGLN